VWEWEGGDRGERNNPYKCQGKKALGRYGGKDLAGAGGTVVLYPMLPASSESVYERLRRRPSSLFMLCGCSSVSMASQIIWSM
jgi:hypothetical protein